MFSASYNNQEEILAKDRDISGYPVAGLDRCLGNCSSGTPQGRFFLTDPNTGMGLDMTVNDGVGGVPFYDPANPAGGGDDFHPFTTADRFNYAQFNLLAAPVERFNIFTKIEQEITPYLPESEMSEIARYLPQGVQERGREIRTFMPRYGCVNERRNQLHEVIRLSGMNLVINDTDHPLIIKVASIQAARMQVYFIDNEDYFQRKFVLNDADGKEFEDNDERAVFFARGVLKPLLDCVGLRILSTARAG